MKEVVHKILESKELSAYSNQEIVDQFIGEWGEYLEARDRCLIGDDPLELAQEGWDVLNYAVEIFNRGGREAVEPYVKAVLSDFRATGIDWMEACVMKESRNRRKYPIDPIRMNGHTPSEAMQAYRQMWKLMNGDCHFYYAWMMTQS